MEACTPSMYIDFTRIESGEDFELLCEDLLQSIGFQIASKVARGPDLGKDIIAVSNSTDIAGINEIHRYLVECKHFALSGRCVKEADVGSPISRMGSHKCDRYILITSTIPCEKLRDQLESIDNSAPHYKAITWSRGDLRRLLDEHPKVRDRYFTPILPPNDASQPLLAQVVKAITQHLKEPGNLDSIKRLLQQNPEIFPIEYYMFYRYEFRSDVDVPGVGKIDCAAARPDSVGVKLYLYYLGTPYVDPLREPDPYREELSSLLNLAYQHATIACGPLPESHPLHPVAITGKEAGGMKDWYYEEREAAGLGTYGSINIYVVIGRRPGGPLSNWLHLNTITREWVNAFRQENATLIEGCSVSLDVLSYDRLLSLSLMTKH